MASTRVLITVLDALRPEFVTPELMPNLSRFAAQGVRFTNSRSTFPTETRVNQSSVVTGCGPARHGMVANKFVIRDGGERLVLNTGDDSELEAAFARFGDRLIEAPTLGENLARAGHSFATISAGTPGGGRLINHMAETHGSFRLAMRRPGAAVPEGVADEIIARLGALPDFALPAIDWISWAVNAYLDHVEPVMRPDVMLLWLCEPDESCHHLGIGAPGTLRAIRHVDAEFGRVLTRQEAEIAAGRLQVIALSDHGQISLEGAPLDLAARLSAAGFEAPAHKVIVANAGGIWLEDQDPKLAGDVVDWLLSEDWCGPVFTRGEIRGTLGLDAVGIDHPRAPDIALVLDYDDRENDWGRRGLSKHDSIYPTGGGCHGGLSPWELQNFLAISGTAFAGPRIVETPAGNTDIAPTVLALLGVAPSQPMDGRVLSEALANTDVGPADPVREEVLSARNDRGPVSHVSVSGFGGVRYLNRAWVSR